MTPRKSWGVLGVVLMVTVPLLILTTAISGSSVAEAQSPQWNTTSPPSLAGSNPYLNGVSCISATSCFAVGGYTDESGDSTPLVEYWNGAQWSVQSAPAGPNGSSFNDVSCTSSTSCVAVGSSNENSLSNLKPFMDTWNGSEWQLTPIPKTNPHHLESLLGSDSCIKNSCVAVGGEEAAGGLTEVRKSGTWLVVANSSPDGAIFQGVSCSSSKYCMAVGEINSGNAPMAYLWNGAKWSPTNVLVEGEDSTNLFGVSCVKPNECFAAGFFGSENNNTPRTLVEEWTGSTWMILPKTPDPGGAGTDDLASIYCTSAMDCVAVGDYVTEDAESSLALIESWHGESWSLATPGAPAPGSSDNELVSVSCGSPTTCMAVGSYTDSSGDTQSLAETGSP